MNLPVALVFLVLLAIVVLVVAAPLRARAADALAGVPELGGDRAQGSREEPSLEQAITRAELEAARESKYREIRDSELDFRTGKLSAEDFAAIDGQLRGEAIAILDRLEALDADAEGNELAQADSQPPPGQPET